MSPPDLFTTNKCKKAMICFLVDLRMILCCLVGWLFWLDGEW